mmetsp:Transcript_8534/g.29090  ORF Transcript_8534/g.29090 Transcript_8534/m.29090 type:complete len:209 (+) Transcript_8534:1533-2159(+)
MSRPPRPWSTRERSLWFQRTASASGVRPKASTAFTGTPCSRSHSHTSSLPAAAAKCRGVRLSRDMALDSFMLPRNRALALSPSRSPRAARWQMRDTDSRASGVRAMSRTYSSGRSMAAWRSLSPPLSFTSIFSPPMPKARADMEKATDFSRGLPPVEPSTPSAAAAAPSRGWALVEAICTASVSRDKMGPARGIVPGEPARAWTATRE